MHQITRISIANRWITFLVVILVVAASITAMLQLKMEYLPDFELPYIAVGGGSEGRSPEDMMSDVAIPVEEEIEKISGLKHIDSTSSEGQVMVFAEFDYGTNMDKVAEKIKAGLAQYPELQIMLDSEDLAVVQIDIEELTPLIDINLSSTQNLNSAQLRELADQLAAETRAVDGLLEKKDETPTAKAIEITGGDEDVLVIPDADALNDRQVPLSWIVETLRDKLAFASLEDIETTPLVSNPDIAIGEVASVIAPVAEAYSNGNPSINMKWQKARSANTVDVANDVMAIIEDFEESHADDGVEITVISDESEPIEESISSLVRDAIIGLVLASLVVLIFLWAFKASMIVIVTIPVSMLIGFLLMAAFGITINMLTLGGMAIAIGRIVDDSIVSLENIYRHLQRGKGFREAAIDGVREVAMPITSATLATVAIFLPMVFVGGLIGELFRPFALTVTFAFMASLLVALVLVPPLTSFLSGSKGKAKFEDENNWYTHGYAKTLGWCLNHRALTVILAVVIFVGSIMSMGLLDTAFLPSPQEDLMTVEIELPHGNMADTAIMLERVEEQIRILDAQDDTIKNYYATVGDIYGFGSNGGIATITVELNSGADNEELADLLEEMCLPLIEGPSDKIRVMAGGAYDAGYGSDSLEIKVIGQPGLDPSIRASVTEVTRSLTLALQELEDAGDIEDIRSDLILDQTNAFKTWDEDQLQAYADATGLSANEVLAHVEMEWAMMRFGWPLGQNGMQTPSVPVGEITAGISVPGVVKSLPTTDQIEALWIGDSKPVSLSQLANVSWRPQSYFRAEGGYAGVVEATIIADNVGGVNTDVQEIIDDLETKLPAEVSEIKIGGVAEQMDEGFAQMGIAILLAIGIAYLIILISFRSWLTPLIIMTSMPMAIIGIVIALLLSGYALGMSAMMGILMLVGIVLTNAIVLLTFVEDRRKDGVPTYEALMAAGRIRLRPILMTSLTTMIALVPLSLGVGEGELIAAELGVVVIGGLFSSTFLTLLLIPVLYSLTERFRRKPQIS